MQIREQFNKLFSQQIWIEKETTIEEAKETVFEFSQGTVRVL